MPAPFRSWMAAIQAPAIASVRLFPVVSDPTVDDQRDLQLGRPGHPGNHLGQQRVDEAGLAKIAELTGGRFFRARAVDELAGIYAEIDKLEPVQRQGQSVRPKIERYPLPLGWALAIGLLALLLRRRA